MQFEVKLPDTREVELTATIFRAQRSTNITETPVRGTVRVSGKGWHTVTLPWSAFEFRAGEFWVFEVCQGVQGRGEKLGWQRRPEFPLRNVRVVKAPVVSLESEVCGKSTAQNGSVEYAVTVGNCTDTKQSVRSFVREIRLGRNGCRRRAGRAAARPRRNARVKVRVAISDRVPPGGHETQVLQAIGNGDAAEAAQLKFITTSEVPHPFILHTPARWREVREKAAKYPWARERADEIIKTATEWQVPEVADPRQGAGRHLRAVCFPHADGKRFAGLRLRVPVDRRQKVRRENRAVSAPAFRSDQRLSGNAARLQPERWCRKAIGSRTSRSLTTWRCRSGVFSEADQRQIEKTFRIFMGVIERACDYGPINNWNVSEVIGAFYCSLVLGDLASAERWFSGPSGICDQLGQGRDGRRLVV